MKFAKIFKILPLIYLIIIVFGSVFTYSSYTKALDISDVQAEYKQLGIDLKEASDYLSDQIKSYVIYGQSQYYDAYMTEINGTKSRENIVDQIIELGLPDDELALLSHAKELSDQLAVDELLAIEEVKKGDFESARQLIFGESYVEQKAAIYSEIEQFQLAMNTRCTNESLEANHLATFYLVFTFVLIAGITASVVVNFWVLNKRLKNMAALSEIAHHVAEGDIYQDVSMYESNDEFGLMAGSFSSLLKSIQQITKEITVVTEEVAEGNIGKRVDSAMFKGDFAVLLEGINTLLKTVIDEEERVGNLKSRFLVNMSHEIRTPMNAIIGLSQLALMREQTQENYETYKKINISSKNLLTIINDILDFSKIEAEKLELYEDDFCLEEIVSNALLVSSERIEDKPIEMLFDIDYNVPSYLYGDKTRLWQVLKNILDNAAKYTEVGRIVLSINRLEDEDKGIDDKVTWLSFRVQDTGTGMSKEQLEHFWSPFEQFHVAKYNKNIGTGLGTAITKQLITLMGGDITVDSILGEGTILNFKLPFRKTKEHSTVLDEVSKYRIVASRILLVDDDSVALEIMSRILQMVGGEPVCASSGAEALRLVEQQAEVSKPFDLIVLDYRLGDLTGIELAQQLKQYTANTKLLMVSAYTKHLIHDDIVRAGFNDIIEKPFVPSTFIQCLCNSMYKEKTMQNFNKFPGARVLICEDVSYNQEVAVEMLKVFGVSSVVAENGAIGLRYLEKDSFDMVLMDIMMPVMDGIQATAAIREKGNQIPIIAMTANVMKEEIDLCYQVGMNGHLNKPIDIDRLYEILNQYMQKFAKAQSPAASDNKKDTQKERKAGSVEEEIICGIDHLSGISRFAGRRELYYRSLFKFVRELPEENMPFSYYQSVDTMDEARRYIHTLKGVAGNLGMTTFYMAIVEFEKVLKDLSLLTPEKYNDYLFVLNQTKKNVLEKAGVLEPK